MTVEVSAPSFCDYVFPRFADEFGKPYVIAPVITIEEHQEVKVIAVSRALFQLPDIALQVTKKAPVASLIVQWVLEHSCGVSGSSVELTPSR